MSYDEVFFYPHYEVVFERSFDDLVEQVWCDQFVDIRPREIMRKWLRR